MPIMSPSFNHSYMQIALGAALFNLKAYSVHAELSIEIEGKEYIPDISVYVKREIDLVHDVVKMTELPLLVVEILSPSQVTQALIEKFEIYLNAGIKSCWLVTPVMRSITVYHEIKKPMTFGEERIIDEKLNISLLLKEIFPF
jgi:Uma2 family endonuclease